MLSHLSLCIHRHMQTWEVPQSGSISLLIFLIFFSIVLSVWNLFGSYVFEYESLDLFTNVLKVT